MSDPLYICDHAGECGVICLAAHDEPHKRRADCFRGECTQTKHIVECIPVEGEEGEGDQWPTER